MAVYKASDPLGLPIGGPIKAYTAYAVGRIVLNTRGDGGVNNAAIEYTINYGILEPTYAGRVQYKSYLARIILEPGRGLVINGIPQSHAGRRYPKGGGRNTGFSAVSVTA
jgi:hypothetical protein